jgi:HD-GYP domain-containing protein (c-di-GMP phosphodiesterase class II)
MSMDISPFEALFSSLAQTSHFNFELWDGTGLLFSSEAEPEKVSVSKKRRDFSAQILSQAAFQYASVDGDGEIFGIPLRSNGQVVGSLIAYSSNSAKPSQTKCSGSEKSPGAEGMKTLLTNLAELIEDRWTFQSETEDMAQELTQSFEDLYLYSRIATQIKTLQVSKSMLEDLLAQLLETMRVDLAFAKLQGPNEYKVLVESSELSDKSSGLESFFESLIEAIPRSAPSLEENYFIVNDSRLTPGYGDLHPAPYRFLAVAVSHQDTFYGWLGLASFNLNPVFHRSELRLLTSIAEQLGVVIDNTYLYRDLERLVINIVKSLVQAIEAKDFYTRGHSERVSHVCSLIAERLYLNAAQKVHLHWASILHDIGKIAIAEHILNKPEALNDAEYGIVKEHPRRGFLILKPLEQLSGSLPGILHHHEHWDGGGYPQGLKGKEIPLLARIVAVADTFDALTSERPYRAGRSQQDALAIMKELAGTQLDPELVNTLQEVMDIRKEGNQGKEEYRDAATFDQCSTGGYQDSFDPHGHADISKL